MTYKELFQKLEKRNPETGYEILLLDENKCPYDRVYDKQFNYALSSDEINNATLYGECFVNKVDEDIELENANQLVLSTRDFYERIEIDLSEEVRVTERYVCIPNTSFYMMFLEPINIYTI